MPTMDETDEWTARMREFRAKIKHLSETGDKAGTVALIPEFDALMEYTRQLFGGEDA